MPSCTGETKPMASSTRSASILNSRSFDWLQLPIHAHAMKRLHLAALIALEARGHHAEFAPGALRLARRGPQLRAANSASSAALSSFSGGFGMISSCTTDFAPCRNDVPMQSEPVSPPPITTTRLPVARIGSDVPEAARPRRAGSAAAESSWPARRPSARGRESAGRAASPRRRRAGPRRIPFQDRQPKRVTPTCTLQWKVTPSACICATRRSMMCFSSLKSGMP